ncbi:MAG: hypothetical protein WCK63_03310 [Betaproteobacteria bacterium]
MQFASKFFEDAVIHLDWMQLAAIVVTLSAIVFVVFSILLLLRISKRTDEGSVELKGLLDHLRSETQGFRLASGNLNSLIDRSTTALDNLEPRLGAVFRGFQNNLNRPPVSPELIAFAQDGINVLQTVADTSVENLAKWQSENASELNRLLLQKTRMEAELNDLRAKFHQSERQVVELKRQNHSVAEAESATAQLRALNLRLVAEARDARRRLLETEVKFEPVIQELQMAKARLAIQARPDHSADQTAELVAGNNVQRGRIVELETAVKHLQTKVQSSEEELSRALREKSFIEERFLQFDDVS